MYQATVGAIWKYVSTVFVHRLMLKRNKDCIRSVHRKVLIKCFRAYVSTGYLLLTILNCWPPMELEILERCIMNAYNRNLTIAVNPINIPTQGCDKSKKIKAINNKNIIETKYKDRNIIQNSYRVNFRSMSIIRVNLKPA